MVTSPYPGGVAQLVERFGRIEEARGSIPLTSTGTEPTGTAVAEWLTAATRRLTM